MVARKSRDKPSDTTHAIPQFFFPNGNQADQIINEEMMVFLNFFSSRSLICFAE